MENNDTTVINPVTLTLTNKEQKKYSLASAIYNLSQNNQEMTFEREISAEIAGKTGRNTNNLLIPTSLRARPENPNNHVFGAREDFLDYLRNDAAVVRFGATVLSLTRKTALPRNSNPATWIAEDGAGIDATSQSFDQMVLRPRRLVAQKAYALDTLRLATPQIETIIRDNMYRSFITAFDRTALQGIGSSYQPTGITNLPGVPSGSNSGSALTFAGAVQLWQMVTENTDSRDRLSYFTTPAIAAGARTTHRSERSPLFILENNQLAGFPVLVSNNVPSGYLIFGSWEDLVLAEFGAIEVIGGNPDKAVSGNAELTAIMFADVQVKHTSSFAVQHHLL